MACPQGAIIIIAIGFLFSVIAIIAVYLRLLSRRIKKLRLQLNDYAVIFGAVCAPSM